MRAARGLRLESVWYNEARRCTAMPFLFYDPTFIILIPGFLLALYAQWKVQSTFNHYSGIRAGNGFTGAQVAAALLRGPGLTAVTPEPAGGRLPHHHDPRTQKPPLSPFGLGGVPRA